MAKDLLKRSDINMSIDASNCEFEIDCVDSSVKLDQYTRISREFPEPEEDALAEQMDALEEY